MITKTQANILEVFVSSINKRFSIKQVSKLISSPYALVHRSIKLLIENNIVLKDEHNLLSLNYKDNFALIAYIESLRANRLLGNRTIDLFVKDVLKKISVDYFIFLIFGSAVDSKDPRDIDVLLIVDDNVEEIEKVVSNISSNFSKNFDINVVSSKSVYEMLIKRDSINVLNETLNKHIIIFGAENYYRILKNARQ